ncbi:MAG: phenylacetic acid degradation protein PaaD [Bacteroidia bacterium]|nr:MAG: phenylacetic acid degradation protein PaaD [Bacteroidia bacterium]
MVSFNKENIIQLLREIPDPEIPVIDIWELGILRDVNITDSKVEVVITPTYSGCPAMKQIEDDIVSKLQQNGIKEVGVKMIYNPPWTTDWITDEAKEKLRKYGIAPPEKTTVDKGALMGKIKVLACPRCGSKNTHMISQFGSTACKALYQCMDCMEPFDYFKCI